MTKLRQRHYQFLDRSFMLCSSISANSNHLFVEVVIRCISFLLFQLLFQSVFPMVGGEVLHVVLTFIELFFHSLYLFRKV